MLTIWLSVLGGESDRDLAVRLKKRDPHAVGDLYDRYGRLAFSVVFRVVRDRVTAEDLVQETFLRVWSRPHLLKEDCVSLGPYILAIARNRAIDYLRSVEGRMSHQASPLEDSRQAELLCATDAQVLSAEWGHRLRNAMGKLPSQQQQVIELAYFEGLSQSEMAERLQQPLGTVKTWVRSALSRLRQELGVEALP